MWTSADQCSSTEAIVFKISTKQATARVVLPPQPIVWKFKSTCKHGTFDKIVGLRRLGTLSALGDTARTKLAGRLCLKYFYKCELTLMFSPFYETIFHCRNSDARNRTGRVWRHHHRFHRQSVSDLPWCHGESGLCSSARMWKSDSNNLNEMLRICRDANLDRQRTKMPIGYQFFAFVLSLIGSKRSSASDALWRTLKQL